MIWVLGILVLIILWFIVVGWAGYSPRTLIATIVMAALFFGPILWDMFTPR